MSINHFLLLLTTRSIKRTLSKSQYNDSCYINYTLSLYYHSHGQVHKLYLKHIQMNDPCVLLQIPHISKSSSDNILTRNLFIYQIRWI